MQGEKPRNEASEGKWSAERRGSQRSGEGVMERATDRDRVRDGEKDTDTERWKQ